MGQIHHRSAKVWHAFSTVLPAIMRLSSDGMNHICFCLPSRSWFSPNDPGGLSWPMETITVSKLWDFRMQLSCLHPMLLSNLVNTLPGPSYNQTTSFIELNHKLLSLEFKLLSSYLSHTCFLKSTVPTFGSQRICIDLEPEIEKGTDPPISAGLNYFRSK